MKKKILIFWSFYIALSLSLTAFDFNKNYITEKEKTIASNSVSTQEENKAPLSNQASTENEEHIATNTIAGENLAVKEPERQVAQADTKTSAQKPTLSRGGSVDIEVKKVELLDWWKEARYVFTTGSNAVVTDVYTGKSFKVQRTMGDNHADSEALTKEDSEIIKSIWGGFTWDRRPVIVTVNGRRLAASMSAMPHAGLDGQPAYANVKNRSDGYGSGQNLDVIKGNGMDGHFDIHFLNSTRHKDGQIDPQHQAMIKIAAGK